MLGAPILIVTGPSAVGKSTVSRLVAATIQDGVHVRIDDFTRFIVNGCVEPWLPEAAQQNRVVGGAVIAAAMQFANSGYTVVVDGNVFPESLEELARAFLHRTVPLHYTILRCDLGTCLERATHRDPDEHRDTASFAQLHARFDNLGAHERHVIEASGAPDEAAAAVLEAFQSGTLDANASNRR
jgi:predicted kinase